MLKISKKNIFLRKQSAMKLYLYSFIFCLFSFCLFAQETNLLASKIPDSLKFNANAVIRLDQTDINISSQRGLELQRKRIITILNEKGMNAIDATVYYNKRMSVNSLEAKVYDEEGTEIQKFKKKDFRDQSMFDGISIALDGRMMFLDYTPPKYPFTIVFEYEVETSNTAFIPQWLPIDDFFVSVEKSVLNISCPTSLGLKTKEHYLDLFKIQKSSPSTEKLIYTANQIPAQKYESFSPDFREIYPWVMFGLEKFNLEGVDGQAKNWKEFGQWYYDQILSGTDELPEETKNHIRSLVSGINDPIEKAKIVYKFVQEKTRYVSIQLGIGGWRPMLAKDVDRLGYGDCKALTNYTKSLLEAVGVVSYPTILFGDQYYKKSIEFDVVSIQGNHMMLAIPHQNSYVWLECTSQTTPFGYQANFTDDRKVLIVKPNESEIVTTKKYTNSDNTQSSEGFCSIDPEGNLKAKFTIISKGAVYDYKSRIALKSATDHDKYYKNYWDFINNLKIESVKFDDNKNEIAITEKIDFSAAKYANLMDNRMMFCVNTVDRLTESPKRIRNRKTPFEISRGFVDFEQISVDLPQGFVIESIPAKISFSNKFGHYEFEVKITNEKQLLYTRTFSLNSGVYQKTEYEDYRLFLEQVEKNDQAKIVLIKKG